MHASASGKVFLAHMPELELQSFLQNYKLTKLTENTITDKKKLLNNLQQIREQGYSVEDEEIEAGAYSIAAPVKDAAGQTIGTISIVGSLSRIKENEEQVLAELLAAAGEISRQFGYPVKPAKSEVRL
ncbi:Pca regulon regulatory protein [compost metagenome]